MYRCSELYKISLTPLKLNPSNCVVIALIFISCFNSDVCIIIFGNPPWDSISNNISAIEDFRLNELCFYQSVYFILITLFLVQNLYCVIIYNIIYVEYIHIIFGNPL